MGFGFDSGLIVLFGCCSISDLGGGVTPRAVKHIWDYGFSTYDEERAHTGAASRPDVEGDSYPPWKQQEGASAAGSTDERGNGVADASNIAFGIMTSSERVTGTVAGCARLLAP